MHDVQSHFNVSQSLPFIVSIYFLLKFFIF